MVQINSGKLKELRRELRHNQTDAEIVLWQYLRRKELGVVFHRQVSIERYIVDFCCRSRKIIVEVDGEIHLNRDVSECDKLREKDLEGIGYKIFRFKNKEIMDNPGAVAKKIKEQL